MTYILLAEDDPTIGEMLRLTLEEIGQPVLHVLDGRQAIEALERREPSLLFLDLLMPHLDGFAVLSHVRERRHRFPVVVLSNLSDEKSRKRCERLGVTSYLVKSNMEEENLLEVARSLLEAEEKA